MRRFGIVSRLPVFGWVFTSCLAWLLFAFAQTAKAQIPASWTTQAEPFKIADTLYYVGSEDLASYLVVTPKGHILINANLPNSPPLIKASVEKLGYRWSDVKILLNSQAHSDHVGGAAVVIRETGAKNFVMEGDVEVVETGGQADFTSPSPPFKSVFVPAKVDRTLRDGDTVELGGIVLTARKTAGHTRGCTTWTMRAHIPGDPAEKLRDIVIVGGTGFWSEYRFVATAKAPISYPGIAEDFARTFAILRGLPVDVFLGAHGGFFNLNSKLEDYPSKGPRVFIDPEGYRQFVASSEQRFNNAFEEQRAGAGE